MLFKIPVFKYMYVSVMTHVHNCLLSHFGILLLWCDCVWVWLLKKLVTLILLSLGFISMKLVARWQNVPQCLRVALGGHWGGQDPAPTGCVSGRRGEEAAGAAAPPLQSRHISSCSSHSVLAPARRPLTSAQAGPLLRTRPWSISACPDSILQLF